MTVLLGLRTGLDPAARPVTYRASPPARHVGGDVLVATVGDPAVVGPARSSTAFRGVPRRSRRLHAPGP